MAQPAEELGWRNEVQALIALCSARLVEVVGDAFGEELGGVLLRARLLAVAARPAGGIAGARVRVRDELAVVRTALRIQHVLDLLEMRVPVRNLQDSGAARVSRDDPSGRHDRALAGFLPRRLMNRLLYSAALGAAAMYFFDPQAGRRRRARTRDKLQRAE